MAKHMNPLESISTDSLNSTVVLLDEEEDHNESVVELLIYDISKGMASMFSQSFTGKRFQGIWHTSIHVFGREYFYGGGFESLKGIFGGGVEWKEPLTTRYGTPVKKIYLGETRQTVEDFDNFIREVAPIRYKIDQYKFFENNCNNFTNECANFLIGKGIPEDIMNLPEEFFETKLGKRFKYVMNTVDDSSPRCEGMGLILLFMNIIFPGFGTVLAGIITAENHKRSSTVIIGIIQLILSVLVVGWIWSIWWGFKIWRESD